MKHNANNEKILNVIFEENQPQNFNRDKYKTYPRDDGM